MTAPYTSSTRPTDSQFWQHVFPAQVPAVWRNATQGLPVHQLVEMERPALINELQSRAGSHPVTVSAAVPGSAGKLGYSPSQWKDWSERRVPLGSFLADVATELERPTGQALYMQSVPVKDELPGLEPLMPTWADDPRMLEVSTHLWIGSGGQRVAIHRDLTHSLIHMIAGTKELWVFPPEQVSNLYLAPDHALFAHPWRSAVDPRQPDLQRFPRFAHAVESATRIRLCAGDIMFMPAFWWHGVDSHGFNVMVNTRWFDMAEPRRCGAMAVFAHAVVTSRSLPDDRRAAFRQEMRRRFLDDDVPTATERDALTAMLHPRTPTAQALWRQPLRLSPEVNLRLDDDGARFEHRHTGALSTLPWDFVPIVQYFAEDTTPSDALAEIERDYTVDHDTLAAHIRALVAGGVLVAVRRSDEDRAGAASAHAALTMPAMPPYYRRATWAALDHLAFSPEPYPHVAAEDQGLLGLPLDPRNADKLQTLVDRDIATRFCRSEPRLTADRSYRLNGHRRFVVTTTGLACRGPAEDAHLAWDHVEILRQFTEPARFADVLERVQAQWNTSEVELDALVSAWHAAGILEPTPAQPDGLGTPPSPSVQTTSATRETTTCTR